MGGTQPPARGPAALPLVLASGSSTRARLLRDAGIHCVQEIARLDEQAVKQSMRAEGATAGEVAVGLAELKAVKVSRQRPEALVIGADQMLSCGTVWFDKPPDLDHARAQLVALRNRAHRLHSAVCLARGGMVLWHHLAEPELTMRNFSDGFLDAYLQRAGTAVLDSVGAYRLEDLGIQLFHRIEGDFFAVLGLPLLPLLEVLRSHQVVQP